MQPDKKQEISRIIESNSYSLSEKHGLELLEPTDTNVYSAGVSTAGVAEISMVRDNPLRKVIATTIDKNGIEEVQGTVDQLGLSGQILIKYEDVSQPLPYSENTFNFVYARLVLHYLSKQQLGSTLHEFYRILKSGGRIFIVVRSTEDPDRKIPGTTYDEKTGLSEYSPLDENGNIEDRRLQRYFHTQESIRSYVETAGLLVEELTQHDEQLYLDFARTKISPQIANVIEVVAKKS